MMGNTFFYICTYVCMCLSFASTSTYTPLSPPNLHLSLTLSLSIICKVMGPAMLDCDNSYLSPEVASLPNLAQYDQESDLQGGGLALKNDADSSSSKNNGGGKKKKNKNNNKNESAASSSSAPGKSTAVALPLSGCLRYVCASAWNPPPPERKLAGDIM
jgi:hypothetical protein